MTKTTTILIITMIVAVMGLSVVTLSIPEAVAIGTSIRENAPQSGQWTNWGGDLSNTKNAQTEAKLTTDNISGLQVDWVYDAGGYVSAFPVVKGDMTYFVSRDAATGATLHAVNHRTGEAVWSNPISNYVSGTDARVSPAIHGNLLILGSLMTAEGAQVFAVNRLTGEEVWQTGMDEHFTSIITQSPTVYKNNVYVGVSSLEEVFAAFPGYVCCTFIGSMASLDAQTGDILWQTYTAPERPVGTAPNDWYSGNSVWGSSPAIDPKRNAVYVATGNNYETPNHLEDCIADAETLTTEEEREAAKLVCQEDVDVPGNLFDAIISFDLDTGDINWANKLWSSDSWNVACAPFLVPGGVPANCPDPFSPDYDFGQAPMLFTTTGDAPRDLVGAGQKSGVFWALDPDNGEIVWSTIPGPGGILGGMQWGSATDGDRVYGTITGGFGVSYDIVDVNGDVTEDVTGGSWWAADAATGEILWQTAAPDSSLLQGGVSVANGILFSGTGGGLMIAMDASTGEILWDMQTSGSIVSAPSIVNGKLIWGTGYTPGFGVPNDKVFALSVN